jgi:hypothetical protein
MSVNGIIIGTFVKKNKILSFLEVLMMVYKIKLEKVYVYNIDTNKSEYLVTFKTFDKDRFIKNLPNSTVMHVKNGCLFSINALNKLIEKENSNCDTPNNEFLVDWGKYKDKLIILTNGELSISNLTKVEDKSEFFNY